MKSSAKSLSSKGNVDNAPDKLPPRNESEQQALLRQLEEDVASHFEYGRAPGVSTEQLLEIQKILNTRLYQSGAFDALHGKKG